MVQKSKNEFSAWKEKVEEHRNSPEEKARFAAMWEKLEPRLAPLNREAQRRHRQKKVINIFRVAAAAVILSIFTIVIFYTPSGKSDIIGKKVLPVIIKEVENFPVITPVESSMKPDSIKVAPGKIIPKQEVAPVIPTNHDQNLAVDNPKIVDPEPPNLVPYTPEPDLLQPIAKNELPTIHTHEMKDRPVSTVSTIIFLRKIIKQQTNLTTKANRESFEHTIKF